MLKRLPRLSASQIVLAAAAVMVVYFLASGAFNVVRSQQLNSQENRLQAEITDLQTRYERLTALEQYLNSDEYIEIVAREQLGLVKPGETAFLVVPTQPSPVSAEGAASDLWWETLIR
ncbi:MAG TPA: septum formation initiator family protein [Dehalococcoidia bacterium]|nr:septum formation initiator family protein [Dehalococcoidia bacterium]